MKSNLSTYLHNIDTLPRNVADDLIFLIEMPPKHFS